MQRMSLPNDQELDHATVELLQQLPKLNITKMLARTGVLEQFFSILSCMFKEQWLPATDREVILFRVCQQNNSSYEIPQHRAFGFLPQVTIDSILQATPGEDLTPWQLELCTMCDQICKHAKLTPQSVQRLITHYGSENQAAHAIFIMSWFNMLTRFADSTGVPIEEDQRVYLGIHGPTK